MHDTNWRFDTALADPPDGYIPTDYGLDTGVVTAMWAAAATITPELAEQAWLVAYATKARWTPERLAMLAVDVPEPLGLFTDVCPEPPEIG